MSTYQAATRWVCVLFLIPAALFCMSTKIASAATCTFSPGNVDLTAFATLLNSCAGQTIQFSAGTYRFTPTGYNAGFMIPGGTSTSPTTLKGNGATGSAKTVFQIAQSGAYQALLWIKNTSNVTIQGIDFEDIDAANGNRTYNSGCPTLSYGSAISVLSTPGYSSVENITISNNLFHDFNGPAWITLNANDNSEGIGTRGSIIAINNNTFTSDALLNGGCSGANQTSGYGAWMITLHGSNNYPNTGLLENISIGSNTFNAHYIQGALATYSNTRQVSFQYNTINGAGDLLPSVQPPSTSAPDALRYAVLIYNSAYMTNPGNGSPPDTIWIVGNTITNPVSCGVYAAKAQNLAIYSNSISGQTDVNDGTIPKGAIALNQSSTSSSYPLTSNNLQNNHVGLAVVGGTVKISGNTIGVSAQGVGAKLTMDSTTAMQVQNLVLSTTVVNGNASSVIGYGNPGHASTVGLTQNGWPINGGGNPSLRWFDSPAANVAYRQFSQVPNITFGGTGNAITASGVTQTQFWH